MVLDLVVMCIRGIHINKTSDKELQHGRKTDM